MAISSFLCCWAPKAHHSAAQQQEREASNLSRAAASTSFPLPLGTVPRGATASVLPRFKPYKPTINNPFKDDPFVGNATPHEKIIFLTISDGLADPKLLNFIKQSIKSKPSCVNQQIENYPTLLHFVITKAYENPELPNIINALVNAKADLGKTNRDGDSPLHLLFKHAFKHPNLSAIAELLIHAKAPLETTNNHQQTPLHVAIEFANSNPEIVQINKMLLAAGPHALLVQDVHGHTPYALAENWFLRVQFPDADDELINNMRQILY